MQPCAVDDCAAARGYAQSLQQPGAGCTGSSRLHRNHWHARPHAVVHRGRGVAAVQQHACTLCVGDRAPVPQDVTVHLPVRGQNGYGVDDACGVTVERAVTRWVRVALLLLLVAAKPQKPVEVSRRRRLGES